MFIDLLTSSLLISEDSYRRRQKNALMSIKKDKTQAQNSTRKETNHKKLNKNEIDFNKT
jgi:hypothetical protein